MSRFNLVLRWGWEIMLRHALSSWYPWCPSNFSEMCLELGTNERFCSYSGGSAQISRRECISQHHPPAPRQIWINTWALLKNNPSNQERWASLRDSESLKSNYEGLCWLGPPKLFISQKKWTLIFEGKFNADYDSAIKHGLVQWSHQRMDVQSWRPKWPKRQYHTWRQFSVY